MDYFVNALSIRQWADRCESSLLLPHLIRRLVVGTVNDLTFCDFPAYESTQRSGFDGIVECTNGNAWVNPGRSVWEMGKDKGVGSKANKEFIKRLSDKTLSESERRLTTFSFVTPRHWENKKDWVKEKRGLNLWKDVRAFDADDLEQWLEIAPAVSIWFGRKIGQRPLFVDDVDSRWNVIADSAEFKLCPTVFLAGRAESCLAVEKWLERDASCLAIETRSPSEVTDFFCAYSASLPEEQQVELQSKSIIVENLDAWKTIVNSHPAILIVEPSFDLSNEEVTRAVKNGHHVLLASEQNSQNRNKAVALERLSQFELLKALEESGYRPVKAEQFARSAGGSIAILKSQLAKNPTSFVPNWVAEANSKLVSACLLLGGWSGSNNADVEAFENIAELSFKDCESELQQLATCKDPLLLHAAGNWRLISKDHAWTLFQNRVSASALQNFESLATEILVDDDPKYKLPGDKRAFANIYGHEPKYSSILKKHVSETLALLGAFGQTLQAASSTNITAMVDRVVANVLSDCTWHRWATLGSRLALLAEASPKAFLSAVQIRVEKNDADFLSILNDEDVDPVFGGCKHAGLLWALETLAWPKEFVTESSKLLLQLSAADPGGRYANRPMSSLCEILSYWMPQTMATVDERIQILDLLIESNHHVGWNLVLSLLPAMGNSTSMPTHRPFWRNWANDWQRGATRGESQKFIDATAKKVIENAGTDISHWLDVIKHVGQFPFSVRRAFFDSLNNFAITKITDDDRRVLSEELAEQINRHRSYPEAAWSIPEETLVELDAVHKKLLPEKLSLRHVWMFKVHPDRFFDGGGDFREREQKLEVARKNAITEVINFEGFKGIELLAQCAESANAVGLSLSMTTGDQFRERIIPQMLTDGNWKLDFARGFIWNRWYPNNWEWVDHRIKECETESQKAWLLVMTRFSPEAWNRAKDQGVDVDRLYWERTNAWNHELNENDIAHAIEKLIACDRVGNTVGILGMAIHEKKMLNPNTLLLPLEKLLTLPAERIEQNFGQGSRYDIQNIIEHLQSRVDVPQDRLVQLEWNYLQMLDWQSGHAPRTLHRQLASSPEFFIEVLSNCFRSRNEVEKNLENYSEEEQKRKQIIATQSYRLLNDWRLIPGTDKNNNIDIEVLRNWCTQARKLATDCGRIEVCDSQIGQLFALAPRSEDDSWPEPICVMVDEIASNSLASGLNCGIRNSRGAIFRSKGGTQEIEQQQNYKRLANQVRFRFPFFAKILDEVSDSYGRESKWWDEQEKWES